MGSYAPIIKGEIEGFKIGLATDLIPWEHTRNLDYDKLDGEWLVGFGIGFNKGQTVKRKIKKKIDSTIFEKSIKSILYLLENNSYDNFEIELKSYLKNLHNWNSKHLPINIIIKVKSLLDDKKLQRALDTIMSFYSEKRVLIALTEYSNLPTRLKELRYNKHLKNITNTNYTSEVKKISSDLKEWIEINNEK